MRALKLPKAPFAGLKVYCNKCKRDNPSCKHFEKQCYRVRLHIPGTKNGTKIKVLSSRTYDDAIKEAIDFKKEMVANSFQTSIQQQISNDYALPDAILKYYQYLDGKHEYSHLKKEVTNGHRDECIRFCTYYADVLKKTKDITKMRVNRTTQKDVAIFYDWAVEKYSARTFNKCIAALRSFYNFLIEVEEVNMKNPFSNYVTRKIQQNNIETLTKDEFKKILEAVDTCSPVKVLGGRGERKNMYQPYLKDAFRLFLLTGCRREEVVDLRWSDIFITVNGTKFFKITNLKVARGQKGNITPYKFIPISVDLYDFLVGMGYNEQKSSDNYILYPERKMKSETLMNIISKSFTHYKEGAMVGKDISLKNLRKTYLTWVNAVMNKDTKILSSHASDKVLDRYYLDPTILSAVEKGALEIKIFGT